MQKINFQNLPSTTTPINATNLNAIQTNAEDAINDVADDLGDYVDGTNTMGSIVVEGISTKNMFDKNSLINGSINATTGAYTYQNYIVVSNYIWLPAGTYTIKMNNSSNIYLHTSCAYNSSKTYSSTLWGETTNTLKTFTLSAGSYVRFSFRNTSYSALTPGDVGNTNIQLEKGSTATSYLPYQELNSNFVEASSQTQVLAGEKYMFNNGYIIYSGTIVVAFSNGIANLNITDLHLSQKPYSVIATISSEKYGIRYDFDNSSATSLRFELFNGSGGTYSKTGNVRFSAIISGITSI